MWSPLDLGGAPSVNAGLSLGDYQGRIGMGSGFLALIAFSGDDAANRTDVFALRPQTTRGNGHDSVGPTRAFTAHRAEPSAEGTALKLPVAGGVHDPIVRSMERRLPRWANRMKLAANPGESR